MGDGQRTAPGKLTLKQRDDRAGAAEHIAEADGDAAHTLVGGSGGDVERLAVHLRQPLRGAHHAGRVDRLVGGDQHHRQRAGRSGGVGDMAGAGGVRRHALQRVRLHHRHVLQGGGMEHKFRAVFVKNGSDTRFVADIGDHGATADLRMGFGQLQVDLPQRVFAVVQQYERARPEGGNLAGKLAADRPPGAGDDGAAALDQPRHAVSVERHLRPVEQILDRHGAKFDGTRFVGVRERGRARGLANLEAESVGLSDDLRKPGAGQFRSDEDQRAGKPILELELTEDRGRLVERAQDAVALDAPAGLAVRGGEQPLDAEGLAAVLCERAEKQVRVLDAADQEDGSGVEVRRLGQRAGRGASDSRRGGRRGRATTSKRGWRERLSWRAPRSSAR